MKGFIFTSFQEGQAKRPFYKLLDIFIELLTHTSGDVEEAIDWLRELDKEYGLTDESYTVDDFIEELNRKKYIHASPEKGEKMAITSKSEQLIRQRSLEQIFGRLKKSTTGNHKTNLLGVGDDETADRRNYQFGDRTDRIDFSQSIRNAQKRETGFDFNLREEDIEVIESEHLSFTSTVLMIDISHSMILYGEDRITPAKKVAMALAELIKRKYPKDTLDIVVFGNDAWQISVKDLPYLKVGPYHTNTVAGLELATELLRKKKNPNKQIFMITDGKPSCLKESDGSYFKNSFGLDPRIISKTLNIASACKKAKIQITTFMIAKDPYLQQFVRDFTDANQGRAFYSNLNGLGSFIFEDYVSNRKKNVR